jgi:hypothetical protein
MVPFSGTTDYAMKNVFILKYVEFEMPEDIQKTISSRKFST